EGVRRPHRPPGPTAQPAPAGRRHRRCAPPVAGRPSSLAAPAHLVPMARTPRAFRPQPVYPGTGGAARCRAGAGGIGGNPARQGRAGGQPASLERAAGVDVPGQRVFPGHAGQAGNLSDTAGGHRRLLRAQRPAVGGVASLPSFRSPSGNREEARQQRADVPPGSARRGRRDPAVPVVLRNPPLRLGVRRDERPAGDRALHGLVGRPRGAARRPADGRPGGAGHKPGAAGANRGGQTAPRRLAVEDSQPRRPADPVYPRAFLPHRRHAADGRDARRVGPGNGRGAVADGAPGRPGPQPERHPRRPAAVHHPSPPPAHHPGCRTPAARGRAKRRTGRHVRTYRTVPRRGAGACHRAVQQGLRTAADAGGRRADRADRVPAVHADLRTGRFHPGV
ncbi:Predicted secretion system X protein GspF-like, partial [Pseudomonas sp. FEN]